MARPERPVDPTAGPVAAFACELRRLRAQAGSPSYRTLAVMASYSATALSKAAGGEQLPTLELTLGYVKACGGDVSEWEVRWRGVQATLEPPSRLDLVADPDAAAITMADEASAGSEPPDPSAPAIGRPRRAAPRLARRIAFVATIAGGAGLLAVLALIAFDRPGTSAAGTPAKSANQATGSRQPPLGAATNPDANSKGVIQPVRRSGSATIVPGHEIDLDKKSGDWADRAGYPYPPYDLEFTLAHHTLTGENPAVLGVLPSGSVGTRRECGLLKGYGVEIRPGEIKPGVMFCVMTDQNRYALLRITGALYDSTGLPVQVTLDIKVWDPQDAQVTD
jgi:hypothetical protein